VSGVEVSGVKKVQDSKGFVNLTREPAGKTIPPEVAKVHAKNL
jgi:hypothetical protein